MTAITQLGTVPLLLHAWGAAKYGDWLILSAIPSYLTLTDLGFGDASASQMTMLVGAGDRAGAQEVFQSAWALLNITSLLVILPIACSIWWIPWKPLLHLSTTDTQQPAQILLVLAAYVVVSQQTGIMESGFRCDGSFARGTLLGTTMRLAETSVACAIGVATGKLLLVAFSYLAVRSIGSIAYLLSLRKATPWLHLGTRDAKLNTIRRLIAPAAAFIAMSLANSLSFQGFAILLGRLLGPVAVTSFVTLRTLSRTSSQLVTTVCHSFWPELSRALGAGEIQLARTLSTRAMQICTLTAFVAAIALWVYGPTIYNIWVRHAVEMDIRCFHILVAASVANAAWNTAAATAMSANRHQRTALALLAASVLSIALARFLVPPLGIAGAATSTLFADCALIFAALPATSRQLELPPWRLISGKYSTQTAPVFEKKAEAPR